MDIATSLVWPPAWCHRPRDADGGDFTCSSANMPPSLSAAAQRDDDRFPFSAIIHGVPLARVCFTMPHDAARTGRRTRRHREIARKAGPIGSKKSRLTTLHGEGNPLRRRRYDTNFIRDNLSATGQLLSILTKARRSTARRDCAPAFA